MTALPRPTIWTRIRSNAGPLTLLSALTSVAFNRALLARERSEQRRLHRLQMSLLQQIVEEASGPSAMIRSSISPLLSSLEEQKRLARRLRTLQLDPLRLGFSHEVLPTPGEEEKLQKAREATTSWSSALFGSGTAAKIRASTSKAVAAIRTQAFGLEASSPSSSRQTQEEDEVEAEWIRALEESIEGEQRSASSRAATVRPSEAPSREPLLRDPPARPAKQEEGAFLPGRSTTTDRAVQEQQTGPSTTPQRRRVYL